ncbi:MAG: sugar phosphate isomerase/epimerase [Armatimonadetes bacterium]|nr:sugar phosphate isomerase/epimerase [Armatimonadota bacterium]
MKIAIIPTTGGSDPFQGMEFAKQLGVEGVHIGAYGGGLDLIHKTSAERAEILKRIRSLGLVVSACIGWGGEVDLGKEEGLKENIEWGKKLNQVAVDISGGLWMAHAGIMPEDHDGSQWRRFQDAIGQIAAHGESIGATMALETGPEPPVVARRMIEDVGSRSLRINFDPANLLLWPPHIAKAHNAPFDFDAAMRDFDPIEGLRTLIPYVVHAHAKDSVLRRDGSCEEVPLGTGMTDWPVLHSIFKENDYQGFYAIEREAGEDAMGDVARAVEFLRSLD